MTSRFAVTMSRGTAPVWCQTAAMPGRASVTLVAPAVVLLVASCAAGPSPSDGAPTTGTVAPDASWGEHLVDEPTGLAFDFPVVVDPVVEEVPGQDTVVRTYRHASGDDTLVELGLIEVAGRSGLTSRGVKAAAASGLTGAGHEDVRCTTPHGSVRRMTTTCRSVVEGELPSISMAIVQSWPDVTSVALATYVGVPEEPMHRYQVSGAVRSIANSLSPGAGVA